MRVRAFAKINLFLDIVGKRTDGYHTLDTVMQSVSLSDELIVEKSEEIIFHCDKKELEGEDNLCVKAAKLFFEEKKIEGGAKISLFKSIPIEAGLGGGSADCAAVLYALNQIYKRPYSEEELLSLAAKLGADVPFCLVGGCKRAGGIGEQFSESFKVEDVPIVIIKPPFGISTKEAFARYDGEKSGFSGDEFSDNLKIGIEECKDYAFNIFERLCTEREEIMKIKNSLEKSGAIFSLLSGSGSAVFGVFRDIETRDRAANTLKADYLVYSADFAKKGLKEI